MGDKKLYEKLINRL